MLVTDAQIHLWEQERPDRPWPKDGRSTPHRPGGFTAEQMLAAFATTEVETRLAAWLLEQPSMDAAGRRIVVLPMAKKDIASLLGTTPETLSRRLADLAREGLIGLAGRRQIVLLDASGLEARAAGAIR